MIEKFQVSFKRLSQRVGPFNLFVWALLGLYLLPVAFMVVTALMSTDQLSDPFSPLYPAKPVSYRYQGKDYRVYSIPTSDGVKEWALVIKHLKASQFVDPQHPELGLIDWTGNWRALKYVYEFSPTWENFLILAKSVPLDRMLGVTLFMALVGGLGVLTSSVVVAYGFSRFPIPGGNLLFYILIATILIPEKVTYIPTYFFYSNFLHWRGTLYPLLLPYFFGNAVYIFLLRQNFMSLPVDLEEAAMIDGAGPLRRLFLIVLPQSWPVVVTVSILHFFYIWNETQQASLYLSGNPLLMPVSFGVQVYQSRVPIQNVIEAASIVVLMIPVVVLFISQRLFMQGMVITAVEK
jgi:multiple sugar transport system permease protein